MACAGGVASAGAQLDFVFMTVGRTSTSIPVGKGTATYYHYGFINGTTGSISKSTLELANGTSTNFLRLQRMTFGTFGLFLNLSTSDIDSDEAGFRTLMINDVKFLRASRATYAVSSVGGGGKEFGFGTSDTILDDNHGGTVIVQLRAD